MGEAGLNGPDSGSPKELQSRCQLRWQAAEGMTGARGSAFKVTHSQDWRVSAGYWQETSVPGHMDVSKELLEHPCNMAAGFP